MVSSVDQSKHFKNTQLSELIENWKTNTQAGHITFTAAKKYQDQVERVLKDQVVEDFDPYSLVQLFKFQKSILEKLEQLKSKPAKPPTASSTHVAFAIRVNTKPISIDLQLNALDGQPKWQIQSNSLQNLQINDAFQSGILQPGDLLEAIGSQNVNHSSIQEVELHLINATTPILLWFRRPVIPKVREEGRSPKRKALEIQKTTPVVAKDKKQKIQASSTNQASESLVVESPKTCLENAAWPWFIESTDPKIHLPAFWLSTEIFFRKISTSWKWPDSVSTRKGNPDAFIIPPLGEFPLYLEPLRSASAVASDVSEELLKVQVGDTVEVAPRTWPGINKEGGAGRVTKINRIYNGTMTTALLFDVKYVLGGSEKKIPGRFVAPMNSSPSATDSQVAIQSTKETCVTSGSIVGYIQLEALGAIQQVRTEAPRVSSFHIQMKLIDDDEISHEGISYPATFTADGCTWDEGYSNKDEIFDEMAFVYSKYLREMKKLNQQREKFKQQIAQAQEIEASREFDKVYEQQYLASLQSAPHPAPQEEESDSEDEALGEVKKISHFGTCAMCLIPGSELAETSCGRHVHPTCAIYTPETYFVDMIVHGVEDVPKERSRLTCVFCKNSRNDLTKSKIQCSEQNCTTAFHVHCAQKHNLFRGKGHEEQAWCPKHLPKEKAKPKPKSKSLKPKKSYLRLQGASLNDNDSDFEPRKANVRSVGGHSRTRHPPKARGNSARRIINTAVDEATFSPKEKPFALFNAASPTQNTTGVSLSPTTDSECVLSTPNPLEASFITKIRIFAKGDYVNVIPRTGPGVNKLGGHGVIAKVQDIGGTPFYDVNYAVGGRELAVPGLYIEKLDLMRAPARRRVTLRQTT